MKKGIGKMPHNKIVAEETEYYVQETLNKLGVHCTSVSDSDIKHFDLVANETPIEVKSCCIVKKNGQRHKYALGYFEFRKDPYNALLQSDAYYCFVIMYNNERLIAGFKKANEFKKFKRFLSIKTILTKKLLTKKQFVEAIK